MKQLKYGMAGLLLAALLLHNTLFVFAGGSSWYCMRKKNGERPEAESDFRFIEQYDGIYLGPDEKKLYLTFDAGYENGNIEKILDVLKKHCACGSFFILKNLLDRNPELVERMAEENHLICNHSLHHKDITKLDAMEIEQEVCGLDSLYFEKTGQHMAKFFRPPEGRFDEKSMEILQKLGYTTVFWSLAYADWDNEKQPDPQYAKNLLKSHIHNGAILLLHPTSRTNADILDDLLTEWEKEGYTFAPLTDITEGKS